MKLEKISIYNFRSILCAKNINLKKYTILIGKNNEGKTNVLSALNIAMETIYSGFRNRISAILASQREKEYYDFNRDYPVQLNTGDINRIKPTRLTLKMTLSEDEKRQFREHVGLTNNGVLEIELIFRLKQLTPVFVEPQFIIHGKKGKGAINYSNNLEKILGFIALNFKFTYIPAVRTPSQAMKIIENIVHRQLLELRKDPEYVQAYEKLMEKENSMLSKIGYGLLPTLNRFIPEINSTNIETSNDYYDYRKYSRRNWELMIDDGVYTNILLKGDGVKNLVAIALLKDFDYNNDGLVAIEEPESHLHSGAIHKLNEILRDISLKQQVLITTHNPCFVNHSDISSNIIVSEGSCRPASNIVELRNELGILVSETLVTVDNMVIVEGESDSKILGKLLSLFNDKIANSMMNGVLEFYPAYSASKVLNNINVFENWLVNCYAVFDNDQSGRAAYEEMYKQGKRNMSLLPPRGKNEVEIEDLIPFEILRNALDPYVNIDTDVFKKCRLKFSSNIKSLFTSQGKILAEEIEKEIKIKIAKLVIEDCDLKDKINKDVAEYLFNLGVDIVKKLGI